MDTRRGGRSATASTSGKLLLGDAKHQLPPDMLQAQVGPPRKAPPAGAHLLLPVGPSCALCISSNGLGPLSCLATWLAALHEREGGKQGGICQCSGALLGLQPATAQSFWPCKAMQGAWPRALTLQDSMQLSNMKPCGGCMGEEGGWLSSASNKRSDWPPTLALLIAGGCPLPCLMAGTQPTWFFSHSPAAAHRAQRSSAGSAAAAGCSSAKPQSWGDRPASLQRVSRQGRQQLAPQAAPSPHLCRGRGLGASPPAP